jgi:hypothetical protein
LPGQNELHKNWTANIDPGQTDKSSVSRIFGKICQAGLTNRGVARLDADTLRPKPLSIDLESNLLVEFGFVRMHWIPLGNARSLAAGAFGVVEVMKGGA